MLSDLRSSHASLVSTWVELVRLKTSEKRSSVCEFSLWSAINLQCFSARLTSDIILQQYKKSNGKREFFEITFFFWKFFWIQSLMLSAKLFTLEYLSGMEADVNNIIFLVCANHFLKFLEYCKKYSDNRTRVVIFSSLRFQFFGKY